MDFELKTLTVGEAAAAETPALIALLSEGFEPTDDALSHLVAKAIESGDFRLEGASVLSTFAPHGLAAPRVVLAAVGDAAAAKVRKALGAAAAALRGSPATAATVVFDRQPAPAALRAAVAALGDAGYLYTTTKSTLPKSGRASRAEAGAKPPTRLTSAVIAVPDAAPLRPDFELAVGVAHGVDFAREWANRPANYATPTMLGDAASELAGTYGFECEVMGPSEVARLGMGAFQAVAQGSREPLRFIALRHRGAGGTGKADAGTPPVVLIGKGITFDTGGISLKPPAEMDEMKFDMSGAASVLGVFRALGELRLPLDVVGLIPACENMPDGGALKPGDVVTSMSGQTIEVLNTDAEGRLVLCDALTYAERYEPRAVIDIATLTGACVIALGGVRSGLFAPDDDLAGALAAAGEGALDPCWRMPLDDDYADALKSNFADVANVGGRPAGAVTAAKFLQRFATRFPWAHLDIAGSAWRGGPAKGATGRPVGLLVHYLKGLVDTAPVLAPAPQPEPSGVKGKKGHKPHGA